MIITLDPSLKELMLDVHQASKFSHVFKLLADIRTYRKHFIKAERELLEILYNSDFLDSHSKHVFKRLFYSYTQEFSLFSTVESKVTVTNSDDTRKENGMLYLNINDVATGQFLELNTLLLEFTTDVEVYSKLADFYLYRNNINLKTDWSVFNGGGTSTYIHYNKFKNCNNNYTFCLVDTDQKSPHCPVGTTSKPFINDNEEHLYGEHVVIATHEIENLIPVKILETVCAQHDNLLHNIDIINKIASSVPDVLKYLDLKSGLSSSIIYSLEKLAQTYWINNLNNIGIQVPTCSCSKPKSCTHFVIPPFGKDILKKVLKYCDSQSINMLDYVEGWYKDVWLRIGHSLVSIFCTPQYNLK